MRVRLSSALLWLTVLVQLLVPASYYLWRDDPDDERFAWRMFSVVRLKRCTVEAWERRGADSQLSPVDLSRALHASWQRLLERGRKPVIRAFLERRCEREPARTDEGEVVAALLERSCISPAGSELPTERFVYRCDSGSFEAER